MTRQRLRFPWEPEPFASDRSSATYFVRTTEKVLAGMLLSVVLTA